MTATLREPPRYGRTEKLKPEQLLGLVQGFRNTIAAETSSAEEASSVAVAILATFCMDMVDDDVEEMAKKLAAIRNRIVNDFRTGRLSMWRST